MFCTDRQHLSVFRHNCIKLISSLGLSMHPRYNWSVIRLKTSKRIEVMKWITYSRQVASQHQVTNCNLIHSLLTSWCRHPWVGREACVLIGIWETMKMMNEFHLVTNQEKKEAQISQRHSLRPPLKQECSHSTRTQSFFVKKKLTEWSSNSHGN